MIDSKGSHDGRVRRAGGFAYGVASYLIFLITFLYAIGFVANVMVAKSIDSGTPGDAWLAALINAGLLGLFGLQHSVMARPAFKRWWSRVVPEPLERSTYVLLASLMLALLFWQWRPMPGTVWSVEHEFGRWLLWGLFAAGWGLVLLSTFLISHAHLFGIAQVTDYLRRRKPTDPGFRTPGLYRFVRHPIMTGFLIAFWATPEMTAGHLLFGSVTTLYILVALRFEEHDLVQAFGDRYRDYRDRVPMFFPRAMRPRVGSPSSRGAEKSTLTPSVLPRR